MNDLIKFIGNHNLIICDFIEIFCLVGFWVTLYVCKVFGLYKHRRICLIFAFVGIFATLLLFL